MHKNVILGTWQRHTLLHLLLLHLLVSELAVLVWACPAEVCICKWKGGKQTVECGGQQLPAIPEGMDPGTQVLNFTGNSLQVLQSERFLRMDLLNLQKIYLSRNQLIRIHEKAFRGLTNLVELDLCDNMLPVVPSETFQDYSSLMRLSLSGNPIRELKTSAFRYLSFLTTLELSNCQIERIENEAFVGMDNLEWLRLDGNRIGYIQGAHILPKSLHGISLQSNRWMCDCRLLDVHAWLVNFNVPQIEDPRCVEPPRLKGQTIKSLKKDELACLPEVSPQSSYTEIEEGRNISIVCVVRAIPAPKVLWLFNGQVMSNDSLVDNFHMYYYIDESGGNAEEKRSEIFIYNVGTEDNGTFSCIGQNVAGTTFSNYTLRVIIKEPPVVNEVSFPRDYMNYIIASSTGGGIIFVVLLCTIVVKCKQRSAPSKRKKCNGNNGVTNVNGNTISSSDGGNNEGGMKCSSILNENGGESLTANVSDMMMNDGLTPSKLSKENGLIMGGQMKQNMMMFAQPVHYQSQSQMDMAQAMQLNMMALSNGAGNCSSPPPPNQQQSLIMGPGSMTYCTSSPPSSLRNYQQEKNPDLVNDAESVKHKLKSSSMDADCTDASSECSGPCSIQGMPVMNTPVTYDGSCYQLTAAPQLMRPTGNATSRFTAGMSTLPRGMQLKTMMSNVNQQPQHQVDVHLNPVCFLGQDGFAHLQQQQQQQPPSHHHLHLQAQHSLGSAAATAKQQSQQQNFYRTLPHKHKQQQFAASLGNPNMRYSLEAEFVQQRSATPPNYDMYLPNVRFTAEGYPQQHQLLQYPSPPEGYKSNSSSPAPPEAIQTAFQQWPACLPGYHTQQPVRYVSVLSPQTLQQPLAAQNLGASVQVPICQPLTSTNHSQTTIISSCSSGATNEAPKKQRCVAAQADASTIPECDETEVSPSTSTTGLANGESQTDSTEPTKTRQLNGPLADSPDEGYGGDAQETSDI